MFVWAFPLPFKCPNWLIEFWPMIFGFYYFVVLCLWCCCWHMLSLWWMVNSLSINVWSIMQILKWLEFWTRAQSPSFNSRLEAQCKLALYFLLHLFLLLLLFLDDHNWCYLLIWIDIDWYVQFVMLILSVKVKYSSQSSGSIIPSSSPKMMHSWMCRHIQSVDFFVHSSR